jgi:GAF domain-containing protein
VVWVSRFEQGGARVLARSGWIPQLFPNAGELHPVAPESEANRVRLSGNVVAIADGEREPTSSMLTRLGLRSGTWLPISVHGSTWGVLCVAHLAAKAHSVETDTALSAS